jgi:hypothetical protein
MGPVVLFVPEEDEGRARELAAASDAGALSLEPNDVPAALGGID